jgi:hypothetical protein
LSPRKRGAAKPNAAFDLVTHLTLFEKFSSQPVEARPFQVPALNLVDHQRALALRGTVRAHRVRRVVFRDRDATALHVFKQPTGLHGSLLVRFVSDVPADREIPRVGGAFLDHRDQTVIPEVKAVAREQGHPAGQTAVQEKVRHLDARENVAWTPIGQLEEHGRTVPHEPVAGQVRLESQVRRSPSKKMLPVP